jgi:HSP20 family molecular chaperone IbpA
MGRLFELVDHGHGKVDVLAGPSLDRAEAGPHTGEKYRVMRYRRLSYRYAMVVRPGRTWPPGEILQSDCLRLLVRSRWRPDADTYETAATVEIIVDLAGVDEDDFEVQLFEDAVVLERRRQAVTMLPSDGVPPGTVGRELRRGWRLGEELLRPAQIVVATSSETARSWR